jgi:hypothetical protein
MYSTVKTMVRPFDSVERVAVDVQSIAQADQDRGRHTSARRGHEEDRE